MGDALSDSHDQSYYEIALTNRQVMSIFVVLLVCVLVSFLGGVWLGRDADATVEMASTQAIVAGDAQDAPLEPLDFFNRPSATEKAKSDLPRVGEASRAEPAQKGEPSGTRPETAPSPSPTSAKPASGASTRTKQEPTKAEKAAGPEAGRKAKAEPAPRPVELKREPTPDVSAEIPSAVVIQVFSSNEEAQALRVADQLRKSGYPAILSPVEVAGRTLHRVRIGPYSDADEAQVVAESVRRAFKFDTWITH